MFNSDKLILIKHRATVGGVPGRDGKCDLAYKVEEIAVLHLKSDAEQPLGLDICRRHNLNSTSSSTASGASLVLYDRTTINQSDLSPDNTTDQQQLQPQQKSNVQKTWNSIKNVTSNVAHSRVITKGRELAVGAGHSTSSSSGSTVENSRERFERRLVDELTKMFNHTESFYYTLSGDLTNSIQRKYQQTTGTKPDLIYHCDDSIANQWKCVDERFFWNKFMLDSLIEQANSGVVAASYWILPVIQGFVQVERCHIDVEGLQEAGMSKKQEYTMCLISRRSRHRAGTRYKRRGVDDEGHSANYVETEQMFKYDQHIVSCFIVRGSVPIYWSQAGHSYRPPPKLERTEAESQEAFKLHFNRQIDIYGKQAIVNLVEQTGREQVIADAYLNHILTLDSDKLTYISFDFHEYW